MVAETITCTECSGPAHRVGYFPPDTPPQPGDIVTYRCEDCGHRMDLVMDEGDEA